MYVDVSKKLLDFALRNPGFYHETVKAFDPNLPHIYPSYSHWDEPRVENYNFFFNFGKFFHTI